MEAKIPFYNIINMFLTGLIFLGVCIILFPNYIVNLLNNDLFKSHNTWPEIILTVFFFAAAYEIGLIINRIGSLLEFLLKKLKLIPFNDNYALFNETKKQYPIMSTLSREYALSRTGIVLFIILLILSIVANNCPFIIVFSIIIFVFYFSCRKHAKKIVTLMDNYEDNLMNGDKNETRNQTTN